MGSPGVHRHGQRWQAVAVSLPPFVLASASPTRLGLLTAAGVRPQVLASGVDEAALTAAMGEPTTSELVAALARAKATAVAAQLEHAVVLGCDSLLSFAGRSLGKPADRAEAAQWWRDRRGREGELLTGHQLLRVAGGRVTGQAAAVVGTLVRFGSPDDAEIAAYVAGAEPLQVAGGFTLEARAGAFVEGIVGDATNVLGVSLPTIRRLLNAVGCPLTGYWEADSYRAVGGTSLRT